MEYFENLYDQHDEFGDQKNRARSLECLDYKE
jgi:hypothetical protein